MTYRDSDEYNRFDLTDPRNRGEVEQVGPYTRFFDRMGALGNRLKNHALLGAAALLAGAAAITGFAASEVSANANAAVHASEQPEAAQAEASSTPAPVSDGMAEEAQGTENTPFDAKPWVLGGLALTAVVIDGVMTYRRRNESE